ncbi:hypothetical protein [Streptomyces sp. NPDC015131]|uniref:hypothetical protein n=1 Tax=Streptomyces sp. NPDC015131 TaxID=3364941 RepID=UPI0036FF2B0A
MAIPGNMLSPTTESLDPSLSGWTPKLNCAITRGTGGRNGDGTLRLTSSAAGEMQARTIWSYNVTPGVEYQTFADAAGTVPERIGLRWLTAAGVEISITWSVTTSSASASWHRISVSDYAPATATRVQVVVSSVTPAGSGVQHSFENIYLGSPMRTTGNLLSADAEGMDAPTLAWQVDANCSIARQTPPVQWGVDWYWAGGHVLAMTVTAGGDASVRTTALSPATPGQEYIGYAYLNPPTAGSTTWVELRFYTAASALITSERANLSAPGTGYYRQKVSRVAPSNAAYVRLAAGITSGTAAQVVRIDGAVIIPAAPLREGSVVPYADASFEKDVAGWTVVSGVATLARLTPWGTDGLEGSYAMTVSSATATTSVIRSAKFPIGSAAAGLDFSAEIGAKVAAGGWNLTRGIRWYSATNVDLGLTAGTSGAVPSPNWWYLSSQHTAPAGATQAAIEWSLTATATSSVLRLDRAALWQSLPLDEIEAHDDAAYITVTFRELTAGDTVTMWRVSSDGTRTLVRGERGLIDGDTLVSDVLVVEDYEAPLGAPVSYYAETRNSSGGLVATRASDTVTLTVGSAQYGWLKDPGNPQRNMLVMIARAPDWARPVAQAEYRVRGRRNSIVLSDTRGGLEGDLTVYTQSDAEREQLHWLLDPGTTLLWQAAPGHGVSDMYVAVGQITEARAGGAATDPWRTWTLPLRQVDMPVTVGVAGSAGRTWQDLLSEHATWGDVLAAYGSWEDVLFNRRSD